MLDLNKGCVMREMTPFEFNLMVWLNVEVDEEQSQIRYIDTLLTRQTTR